MDLLRFRRDDRVVGTALATLVLFIVVMLVVRGAGAPHRPERRRPRGRVIFCGSKKTLASGVPMAQMIFGANPALGLILMPPMLYHPLQLGDRRGARAAVGGRIRAATP